MIFLTVGTQLPFERLVRVVDDWAGRSARDDVFGQIGPSSYYPRNMRSAAFLSADECRQRIQQASVVIAHAGMGSVITALELGKPIIVMPRRADFGEHRNDHQIATAKWLSSQNRVMAAFDNDDLMEKLTQVARVEAGERITSHASPRLLSAVKSFIDGNEAVVATRWARPRSTFLPAVFGHRRLAPGVGSDGAASDLVGSAT